jgi:NADPH:quinone reductase-like Zn-dependent oxidoreductase
MKAIVHSRYGPPDVLELNDIDQPVVNDDDVLVRVHAAAVGKGDWLTVKGLPYVARMRYGLRQPKHPVPGFDVAGRVEVVGSNVTSCSRVMRSSAGATGPLPSTPRCPRASSC